jgi:subtilisin family serine protease
MKTISLAVSISLSVMMAGTTLIAAPKISSSTAPVNPPNAQSIQSQIPKRVIVKDKNGNEYVEGEVIIKYKSKVSTNRVSNVIGISNIHEIHEFKVLSTVMKKSLVKVHSKTFSTQDLINEYVNDPDVEYVQPNYIYHPYKTPNDPKFNLLWGQHNTGQSVNGHSGMPDADMDAPEAWNKGTGKNDVVIAVIDTGVDYLHEDLAANMWVNTHEIPGNGIDDDQNGYVDDIYGINTTDDPGAPGDPMDVPLYGGGHGTHVAGTIAGVGNNGKGVVGVSWNSKIMAIKYLGRLGGATSWAIKSLEYIIGQKQKGVNIVASNNSWGGGTFDQGLHDAIKASNDVGILFIAAAGNDHNDNDAKPSYPASYDLPGILAVAATNQNDELASFSNYGKTKVDLAAPGTNIYSTIPREYQPKNGDISFDDFEGNSNTGWFKNDNGSWNRSDDQEVFGQEGFPPPPSPSHFLSDSPGANYAPDVNEYIGKCVDLSAEKGHQVFLGFSSAEYIRMGDHGYLLMTGDQQNWYIMSDFEGKAEPWEYNFTAQVPDSFKTANFCFAFDLVSSQSSSGAPGWLIDNVGIGTKLTDAYGFKDGTSMATPQVAGAAALISSVCGNKGTQGLKSILMNSVDTKASLSGKVLTGGRLNVNKAIQSCSSSPSAFVMTPIYYLLLN